MLPAMKYAVVNGVRTDHSSISVQLNAIDYAIKEIHWSQEMDPAAVFANDPAAIGFTRGQYKPSFGFQLWLDESEKFQQDLTIGQQVAANGFVPALTDIWFPVHIYFQPESAPSLTITFRARVSKCDQKSEAGSEHHYDTYDCKAVTPMTRNGRVFYAGSTSFT
jgi:hypothetical protein